tara:strand:+ start:163 stop:318 length:156 start_codon:yes stop_codon:yes gene_type:complete
MHKDKTNPIKYLIDEIKGWNEGYYKTATHSITKVKDFLRGFHRHRTFLIHD